MGGANCTVMVERNPAFMQKAPGIRGGVWGEAPRFFLFFKKGASVSAGSSIDRLFIVLTDTKSSNRHIPVWARYSPHRTRVEAHANTLSP
jgi:hypothetical protein